MSQQQDIIIYNTADGKASVALYAKDGNAWMNQAQLAELFDTSKQNISLHIENILKDNELEQNSVVKDYLTTAADNKNYRVAFYSLEMILAIGYRVRSKRGVQFRIWATNNLKEYMVTKGKISKEQMQQQVGDTYALFNHKRKTEEAQAIDLRELEAIKKVIENE